MSRCIESRYARPDQEHTWSGGEELIAVRLDLRAYTPTFAAHWMLAPRYGSEAFRTHDTCLTMRSILGISIISISIVVLLAGFAPRKFCVGFKQGYTAGYRRGLGIDQPVTFPACPASAPKSPGGREAGYLIGFMQGMAAGERDWAILGRRVFFHHTSPKLG